MTRLVFRNKTCYPDAEVKRLVRFAFAELELPRRDGSVLVRVGHTRVSKWRRQAGEQYRYGATGTAYPFVWVEPDAPRDARWEIHLRVGKPDEFPVAWYDRARSATKVGMLADWREALVAIAAHEGKHVEHYQRLGGAKSWRRRKMSGQLEEERCDRYAARRLAALRDQQHDPGPEDEQREREDEGVRSPKP